MTGFVIPFKSKAKSKNWELDCAFLLRTIRSVLKQLNPNFKCYVVYSDLPLQTIEDAKVEWINFPYPFLESREIEDEERCAVRYGLGSFLPNFYDQGKKILYGASRAKQDGCDYITSLDADDMVSRDLVSFIERNKASQPCGWFVNKGYMHAEDSSFLLKVPKNMNYVCASVNIVRSDLIPDPDFSGRRYQDFQFFSSHAYMVEALKDNYNLDMLPVPFYSLVYLIHQSNFFSNSNQLTSINFKNLVKRLVRGNYLTSKKREEFGLYRIEK
jgi:hypothetical protein